MAKQRLVWFWWFCLWVKYLHLKLALCNMKMNGKVHTDNLKTFSLLRMTLHSKYKDHKLRERRQGWKEKFIFSTFNDTFSLLLEQETPYFHFALEPANYVADTFPSKLLLPPSVSASLVAKWAHYQCSIIGLLLECTVTGTQQSGNVGFSYKGDLLLLLLSGFSRATPEAAAHQAAPSLGFSRQEE